MNTFFARSLVAVAGLTLFACAAPVATEESVNANESEIVGGSEATPGAWAGAAAMMRNGRQICGGTLVAPNWVLSAGHCVVSTSQPNGGINSIVVGRHKLSTSEGENIPVKKAYRHPGFSGSTLDNDISLFELERPATAPMATLIAPEQFTSLLADGAPTTVVGWGTTSEGGRQSDVLLQVEVPVISNERCAAFPRYNTVTGNMFCAGYTEGGRDSCQGDSGGPIFSKVGDQVVQVGLVSWGIGCARRNAPGVYTRVGNYLEWMKTTSGGAIGAAPTTEPVPNDGATL